MTFQIHGNRNVTMVAQGSDSHESKFDNLEVTGPFGDFLNSPEGDIDGICS